MAVSVKAKTVHVLIGGFNRSPDSIIDFFTFNSESINHVPNTNINNIIIVGDFNYAPNFGEVEGHIGLGLSVDPPVRLSVTLWQLRNSRTAYARILKLYMWHVHENKGIRILFPPPVL